MKRQIPNINMVRSAWRRIKKDIKDAIIRDLKPVKDVKGGGGVTGESSHHRRGHDLINNPLTRGNPTSIVIKLLATVPVGGTCNNSALLAGDPTLALGMAAWGTTLHANSSAAAGTYAVTETAFTPATLSAGEFARLAYGCGVVANVGSGFGICNSCRLGGLGATKNNKPSNSFVVAGNRGINPGYLFLGYPVREGFSCRAANIFCK